MWNEIIEYTWSVSINHWTAASWKSSSVYGFGCSSGGMLGKCSLTWDCCNLTLISSLHALVSLGSIDKKLFCLHHCRYWSYWELVEVTLNISNIPCVERPYDNAVTCGHKLKQCLFSGILSHSFELISISCIASKKKELTCINCTTHEVFFHQELGVTIQKNVSNQPLSPCSFA